MILNIFFVICLNENKEYDIAQGSIFIRSSPNSSDFWEIEQGGFKTNFRENDPIKITGSAIDHTINVLDINETLSTINLIFTSLALICVNETPLLLEANCAIEIQISDGVELSSQKNDLIRITEKCKVRFFGNSAQQKGYIRGSCEYGFYIIRGENIILQNLYIDIQNKVGGGLTGKKMIFQNCDFTFESILESIGGFNCEMIEIVSSSMDLVAHSSTCIGSASNKSLDISVIDSKIYAKSKLGAAIGNGINTGQILILRSYVNASVTSDFSTIGFAHIINITESEIESMSTTKSAIGGGREEDRKVNCSIFIYSSKVSAESSGDSAVIGGSSIMTTNITIKKSNIRAKNNAKIGGNGAAIGGGTTSKVKMILIEDCFVDAFSESDGAAIGSGGYFGSIDLIRITNNSIIYAQNNGEDQHSNAGIGGFSSGKIELFDSYISSHGGGEGAGIGGGPKINSDSILIERCRINASSKTMGAGIGSSAAGLIINGITIRDSEVFAFSGNCSGAANGAAIGGGYYTDNVRTIIERCNVTAIAGYFGAGAGIGGGLMGGCGEIIIKESNVYAMSGLKSEENKFSNHAGSGIGSGGTVLAATGAWPNRGSVFIYYSNITAKGGSIRHISGRNLTCGAGIGFGGVAVSPRFPKESINISILGSNVFSYGGNASHWRTSAASAFMGGDGWIISRQGDITIENSTVHALSGYNNEKFDRTKSVFGYIWHPIEGRTGTMSVKNSIIYGNHSPEDNQTIPIIMHEIFIDGEIVLHSTENSSFEVDKILSKVPVFEIANLEETNIIQIKVIMGKNNYVKIVNIIDFDRSVAFSVNDIGIYRIFAKKYDCSLEFELLNNDNSPFNVSIGMNIYDNYFLHEISIKPTLQDKQHFVVIIGLCVGIPIILGLVIFIVVFLLFFKKHSNIKLSENIHPGISDALNAEKNVVL